MTRSAKRRIIGLAAVVAVGVSVALFFAGRRYRNQNVPLWRVNLSEKNSSGMVRGLTWARDGKTLWVLGSEAFYGFGDDGRRLSTASIVPLYWGVGPHEEQLMENQGKIYEWKNGRYNSRNNLKNPAFHFGDGHFERDMRINWDSLSVLGSDARGPVYIWSLRPGSKTITLPPPLLVNGRRSIPYDFAISPDRRRAVVVYDLAWNIKGWNSNWATKPPTFLSDGGRVVLFDLQTRSSRVVGSVGTAFSMPPRLNFGQGGVVFSPSGRWFSVYEGDAGGALQIYDSISGRMRARATMQQKIQLYMCTWDSIAFSPDDTMLAANLPEGWIQLWDVASGVPLQTLRCRTRSYAMAWSPDSQTLASGCYNGDVSVWNVAPFAPPKTHSKA